MVATFAPKLDILPPAQRQLWGELSSVPEEFVLYGGTALALHLGHRDSIDFDFFANRDFDPKQLYDGVPFLQGSRIIQQQPSTLTCLVGRDGDVKVSFFGVPRIAHILPPHICSDNGLKVASLLDLAGTKAGVVQQRAQAKDYMDIDALIQAGIGLPEALAAAKLVYGASFAPTPTLKALTFFGDGDLATLPMGVRQRLVLAAAQVDPLRLPSLTRTDLRTTNRDTE